jgi:hypothetical protein
MSKYIVGGGIAGLIASFYNPDFQIITDKIGGQMATESAGPRILEVNEYSETFLKDLGLKDLKTKVATIGYKVKGKIINTIDEDLRRKYYLKSRCLKNAALVPSSIMSDGKNTIEYFDINWDDIIFELISKIKCPIIGRVTDINIENKTLNIINKGHREILNYDNLISTIPAPIFFNLADIVPDEELKYLRKIFIISNEYFINTCGYDYIYYPENDYKFHRISKDRNGKIIIEFTTNENYMSILNEWDKKSNHHVVIPIGQIQSGKVQKINNISFLGRYSEWDHDIKVDDIVRKCKGGLFNE